MSMPETTGSPDYNLRLYVAGQTPKSVAAIANLKKLCERHLAGRALVSKAMIVGTLKPFAARATIATFVRRVVMSIDLVLNAICD